jgi:transposase InsO family protein
MPIKERTIVDIREEMARLALDERYTVTEVAERYGYSRPSVRLWRDRYREGGRAGLVDLSHAPHWCPHRTTSEIEELIVAERETFKWGSKKILRRLRDAHPEMELPGRSAVDALLKRRGLVATRRRRYPVATPFQRRYTASAPGELSTIDHKGQFKMLNGEYCFPLTIVDSVSRYVQSCKALRSTRLSEAWPEIERVFREYGLPDRIRTDNGTPFAANTLARLSTLAVWWVRLGIRPELIEPGKPQQNGRHERMHRTLKREAARPPEATLRAQQRRFDTFRFDYNYERPHEALGQRPPVSLYTPSPRPYPRRLPLIEYPPHFEVRRVSRNGGIRWQHHRVPVSHLLLEEYIGFEEIDDGVWTVYFGMVTLGWFDERAGKIVDHQGRIYRHTRC